jgi:hypothetical protein
MMPARSISLPMLVREMNRKMQGGSSLNLNGNGGFPPNLGGRLSPKESIR